MKPEELYELWKEQRANVAAPDDFADRVMASVGRSRRQAASVFWLAAIAAFQRSRVLRAAVFSLAVAALLSRLACVLTIFMPS